ncbi:MAG: hypothetical protein DMG11_11845, partial [Acidobacteria bacterium]
GYYALQGAEIIEATRNGNTIPGFGHYFESRRQVFRLNETHVFGPALVNEVQFLTNGFVRDTGRFNFPSVAAFLDGTGDSFTVTLGDRPYSISQGAAGLFVQDNYKWRPNVTLELGLRYKATHLVLRRNINQPINGVRPYSSLSASSGLSDFDARHRFVVSSIYEFPFKRNRLVSGWQVSAIVQAQSGNPINIVTANGLVNGVANTVRPDLTGPVKVTGNVDRWFDTSATTNRQQLVERSGGTGAGVVVDNNQARTLDAALRFHPGTEQVFVINGTPGRDKSVETLLKEQFKGFENKVAITYLTDLSLNELIGYECGVKAASIALYVTDGADPDQLSIVEVPSIPMFDWRQLRRRGITEDKLPPGSKVQFRELTVFEQYKWRIIGGLVLGVVQSFLIAGLLAERRRRRLAQTKLLDRLQFETLLSELSAEFTTLPAKETDQAIEKWLRRLSEFLGAESGNLFKLDALPDGAPAQYQSRHEVALAIPIHVDGSTWTFTFQAPESRRVWAKDLLPRIRLAGEILAGALARKANAEALRESQERYQLATSSGRVAVWDWNLDTSDVYADPLLKSILGYEDHEIRNHFDDWIRLIHPEDVNLVMEGLRDHIEGRLPRFESEHRLLQKDGECRWFLASGTLVRSDGSAPLRMLGTVTDITQRKLVEQEMQLLSTCLLDAQDQERRRIARELHDGTAQNLWAIALNLGSLESQKALPVRFRRTLSESRTLCTQSLEELRTLSYVLHPPMLDQAGLLASLRWYLAGFTKRTGIHAELVATEDIGRLPARVEMDLFRIVQECLSNIHRHSGSRTAQVQLKLQPNQVMLLVQDQGRGMPVTITMAKPAQSGPSGVGLSGMAQRLRHLGGHLEIASDSQGTKITAIVPLGRGSPSSENIMCSRLLNESVPECPGNVSSRVSRVGERGDEFEKISFMSRP